MVIIQQHGPNGELFDFNNFLIDIKELQLIEEWQFRIEECLGKGAREIESLSNPQFTTLTANELKNKYQGIYQTINGEFIGFVQGRQTCSLFAIDSSYWEVSGSKEVEMEMVRRYGLYSPAG